MNPYIIRLLLSAGKQLKGPIKKLVQNPKATKDFLKLIERV